MQRPELDQFKDQTIAKAAAGECEGACEEHRGSVRAFRVRHIATDGDRGYFAYCEAAQEEDERRGMELVAAEQMKGNP